MTVWAGLLVAACINQAPEGTFGAAVAEMGIYDMLKVGRRARLVTTVRLK